MDWLGIDRRRLGTGLLAFGLAGMVMAGIVAAALVLGAFAVRDLDDRLAADQARIAASLTRLSVTMESLARTTDHAATTLETSSGTLADAETIIARSTQALVALSAALDVSVLGNRPFASASEAVADLARTLAGYEGKAQALAANLHQNALDAGVMTDHVRDLKTQLNELATRITSFDRIDEIVALAIGGIVLLALLTAWVAVGAGACAWAGWRLRRAGAPARLEDPASAG